MVALVIQCSSTLLTRILRSGAAFREAQYCTEVTGVETTLNGFYAFFSSLLYHQFFLLLLVCGNWAVTMINSNEEVNKRTVCRTISVRWTTLSIICKKKTFVFTFEWKPLLPKYFHQNYITFTSTQISFIRRKYLLQGPWSPRYKTKVGISTIAGSNNEGKELHGGEGEGERKWWENSKHLQPEMYLYLSIIEGIV